MAFKREYLHSMVESIMKIDPKLEEDKVTKIVTRVIKERMRDPSVILDNNVTGDNKRTTLSELCKWIDKRDPVISGNATFYMQPDELLSPTSNMLKTLKKERKEVKNEMFQYKPDSDEYGMMDLDQGNKKVVMNAEYGGSGTPTAAFYTKYSPAATTLMAQSIITTMAAFFEGYVGDNQVFFHINECFDWMNTVTKKDEKIPNWIVTPTPQEVLARITRHFYLFDISDYEALKKYIMNCNETELTYLYYANNLNTFIQNHPNVQKYLRDILSSLPLYEAAVNTVPDQFRDKFLYNRHGDPIEKEGDRVAEYNKWISKEMFLNPYKIPDVISEPMKKLVDILTQFIYVEYITPDSIVKLNNHKRNTVLLVDTDSNVINADLFVSFVLNKILPGENFCRPKLYNEMILVNVLAAALDTCVKKILDYYGRMHHMDEKSRAELTMKNEFMFRRFFLMKTKKRYAASIALREGNIMIPFKLEIKGLDFIKSGVTEEVTDRFTKMLEEHVLFSDNLELHQLMKDLKQFENEIYHDLRHGGTKYLKPQTYKPQESYKKIYDSNGNVVGTKAWSLPVFRGSAIWNILNPNNRIYSLDRVKLIKLVVTGPTDIERMKQKYPNEYKDIMDKVFNSEYPDIRKAGLKVISIPAGLKKIPDWLIDIIDYDVIVSDVIASFRSVLEALNIEEIYFKTPNGNANLTSCLISL